MATVTTPVPPPVKNDWLSSALENPRLSPPSPGGPRKAAPQSQVNSTQAKFMIRMIYFFVFLGFIG